MVVENKMRAKEGAKEAILREAADLFAEKGYWKTTIRDVAGRLNIPNPSIYYYFENKEHLLFEIIEASGLGIINELEQVRNQHLDPVDKLANMIYRHIAYNVTHKNGHKVFIEEGYHLTGKLYERIVFLNRQIYNNYYYQIKILSEQDLIKDAEYSVLTFTLLGAINWVYRWFKEDGKLSIEDVTRILINTMFLGLLNKSAARKISKLKFLPSQAKSS
jgi:AcrR family transcriptional regulator